MLEEPPFIPAVAERATAVLLPDGVPQLRSIYMYLTTGCNLCCRHCWITPTFVNGQPSAGDVVDCAVLLDVVDEARQLGLRHVKLTGGEPMLHPQFREVVQGIADRQLPMDMETNGTLIGADDAAFLAQVGRMNFISTSLDSVVPAQHDEFRGRKGAYEATVAGIKHLVAADFRPQIIMSPHRGNVMEVDAMVDLAAELGAGSVKLNIVSDLGRGKTMKERGQTLDYDETRALVRHVSSHVQHRHPGLPIYVNVPPAMLSVTDLLNERWKGACGILGTIGVLGSGHIAMCGIGRNVEELLFGRLGQDRLRDIWIGHPVLLRIREGLRSPFPGVCGDCLHAPDCRTGCVAVNYACSGAFVTAAPLCKEAEERGDFPVTRRRSYREPIR